MGTPTPQERLATEYSAISIGARFRWLPGTLARKVPEITIYFWIVKVLSTALGEATSDYLVYHINPYVAVISGGIGFVAAMVLQLAVRRYIPWVYWLAVVMVAIFGTMAADVVHIVLGVPYQYSTAFFAAALAVIFVAWYAVERTLSIHTIYTFRRELFYWATVVATFAMGTALGDMSAYTLHWGFLASGVLFAVLFLLPGVGYKQFGLNAIFAFWFAYIMTRPLGASFADWIGKEQSAGGLGVGTGIISVVLAIVIAGFVGYLTVTRKDLKGDVAQPQG